MSDPGPIKSSWVFNACLKLYFSHTSVYHNSGLLHVTDILLQTESKLTSLAVIGIDCLIKRPFFLDFNYLSCTGSWILLRFLFFFFCLCPGAFNSPLTWFSSLSLNLIELTYLCYLFLLILVAVFTHNL